ncbi:hypothetical protein [Streptomyces olivaceus]|uniref:hypothetical protein n=1 Tax=Streptomyces olivaceus TaxID=47716 RepID=UPI0022EE4BF9|nr:hypothetical protein [Streptomyces olivaceus]GHI98119.1 hypothetical protein TPA0905_75900 [Streptomyces olivaceus]
MTTSAASTFAVYGRIIDTTPLYQVVCDHCPRWLGPVTDDLDQHVRDARHHAAQHPAPPTHAWWLSGSPPPRRPSRGEEVGQVPIYRVICDECPRYTGGGCTDREQLARYIALHVAVHETNHRVLTEGSVGSVRAHQAAVEADPGRWY